MQAQGDTIARRLRISGRVQGVWYRGWTVDAARQRGLRGWVRNRADGSVEALVIGPEAEVEDMIEACWSGPSAARVAEIEIESSRDDGSEGFDQRPSL